MLIKDLKKNYIMFSFDGMLVAGCEYTVEMVIQPFQSSTAMLVIARIFFGIYWYLQFHTILLFIRAVPPCALPAGCIITGRVIYNICPGIR